MTAAATPVRMSLRGCSLITAAALVVSVLAAPPLLAATTGENEPNNSRGGAQVLDMPTESWDPFIGKVDSPGDVDWYAFDVAARQAIYVTVESYGSKRFIPVMRLENPAGETVAGRNANGTQMRWYARTAGRYYVRIAHVSEASSGQQYTLSIGMGDYPGEPSAWSPTPVFPPQQYDLEPVEPPWADAVEAVDVTGDGSRDVLSSGWSAKGPALYVFPSRPGGWLDRPRRYLMPEPAPSEPYVEFTIASGDLVGNDRPDVAVGVAQGVRVFEQRDGSLRSSFLVRTPYAVRTVILADIDRDGRRDIVASTTRGVVIVPRIAGGFGRPRRVVSMAQDTLRVVDVVGSPRPDLVAIRAYYDPYVRIYRQRSDGSFARPTLLLPRQGDFGSLDGLVVADVSGDASLEILAQWDTYLNVFTRTANGWSVPRVSTISQEPIEHAADLSGDGRLELVTPEHIVYLDASGVRTRVVRYWGDENPRGPDAVEVEDVEGDRSPDIVVTSLYGIVVARSGFNP